MEGVRQPLEIEDATAAAWMPEHGGRTQHVQSPVKHRSPKSAAVRGSSRFAELASRTATWGPGSMAVPLRSAPGMAPRQQQQALFRSWVLWPLGELLVLFLCVTPTFVKAYNPGPHDRASFVHPVAIVLHLMYVSLRVYWKESLVINILLMVILCFQCALLIFFWESCWSFFPNFLVASCWCIIFLYVLRFMVAITALRAVSQHLVSKKKRRFVDSRRGLDLDLSYITRQVIAMGFPTEHIFEQQFRNPMDQVQELFRRCHARHYKVYNLCAERTYTHKCFEREYHEVRFPDHNPCPLEDLLRICRDMEDFCMEDRVQNVVAVHCKAGKGRTGLVVSAFLLHIHHCCKASDALEQFARRRAYNGKGVTIPSQIRYVGHYETVVKEGGLRPSQWLHLQRIEVTPMLEKDWNFQIARHSEPKIVFNSRCSSDRTLLLEGDVKIVVFHGAQKLFHLWLHTAYDPKPCRRHVAVSGEVLGYAPKHWRIKNVAGEVAESSTTVVWMSHSNQQATHLASFRRDQLDGPHKKTSDDKEKVGTLVEFRLFFTQASVGEVQRAQLDEVRRRAHRNREEMIRKRLNEFDSNEVAMVRPTSFALRRTGFRVQHSDEENINHDYDDLEHDTDSEENLSIICRGYLLRSKSRCSAVQQRHCELDTSGRLYISGSSSLMGTLDSLVVDLAQGSDNILMEECEYGEEPQAWRVRNPRTHCWELLEAKDPMEARRWQHGFVDAERLGTAESDAGTLFSGFFWKLNSDMNNSPCPTNFEVEHWRIRLFVLRADGALVLYSWKTQGDTVLCNFSAADSVLERLPLNWRGMPHIVLFRVLNESGQEWRTLAANNEDFEVFAMRVASLRRCMQQPVSNM